MCFWVHLNTPPHTHRHIRTTTLFSVKTCVLSQADETLGFAPNDSAGENEQKSTERFRRLSKVKTTRCVQHFRQFNTVLGSNVVIVLSFSLYPVILNDRVEERKTCENVFFPPACVSLSSSGCMCKS